LAGDRGGVAYDIDALCEVAAAIGRALTEGNLAMIEVNPLILSAAQPVAVDAVVF